MFGLLKVLSLPLTGPFIGTQWIAGVLLEEAERQLYDEAGIHRQMAEVERQFQLRQIDATTFERQQETLLSRLMEARAYHRRKNGQSDTRPAAQARRLPHANARVRADGPAQIPKRRMRHGQPDQ